MAEREVLEVDVLIVGAGPAGLSCAIRLHDQCQDFIRRHPEQKLETPVILVIEKGVHVGAHILSGAVLDPRALDELLPDWKERGAPITQKVESEEIWLLSAEKKYSLPSLLIPPYLCNHGNYIISLGELTRWLAEQARSRGVEILEGVAGAELLTEGQKVCGVRCGDSGVGKDGAPRAAFQAGAEIRAKVTVLSEGVRGSLTKQLIRHAGLDHDRHPQTYAIGVKEIWEVPPETFPAGKLMHSLGYPLQQLPLIRRRPDSFGGGFIYGMDSTHLIAGLVVGLDYQDAALDPHAEFNRFKRHLHISPLLEGGKLVMYGAKAIPEGGFYAMPRFYGDGFCLIGDSASFLNAARLKGIHLAMKSGMLAAEAITEALLHKDYSRARLGKYEELFKASWASEELYKVRNWRAAYGGGLCSGAIHDLAQRLTGGRGFRDPLPARADHLQLRIVDGGLQNEAPRPDGKFTFDKVSDVYHSGTNHAEDQPCHLVVPDLKLCVERCTVEYGNPCRHFCPAAVYEWIVPEGASATAGRLQINPGNCVHCKTCDIKDPYENIQWVAPEGGGGPRYNRM